MSPRQEPPEASKNRSREEVGVEHVARQDIEHVARQDFDIQAADPKLRRLVLGALTGLIVLASLAVVRLDAYFTSLQSLAKNDVTAAAEKIQQLSNWLLIGLGVVTVLFGLYLVSIALRVLTHQRYPPPGMRVINDTKVLRGRNAKVYGGVALCLALAVLVAGVVIPWKAQDKLDRVLAIGLQPTPQTPQDLGLR